MPFQPPNQQRQSTEGTSIHCLIFTALCVVDSVVLVADKLNNRLSVVSPQTLAAAGDAAFASTAELGAATRRVTFDSGRLALQPRRSSVRRPAAVNSIRASFAMESASFTLYSSSTLLVRTRMSSSVCPIDIHTHTHTHTPV